MGDVAKEIPTLGQWAQQTRAKKAPQFIIYPIIPADNLILLSGVPKDAQKTFLAMTLSLVAATGISVGALKCNHAVPVLYVYEEGDCPGTLARFDAISAAHGFGKVDEIDNFYFLHRSGFSLDDAEWVEYVGNMVRALNIQLLVVDTLAKCMQGDESNAQCVGNIIRNTGTFRKVNCSVMFVHHTRKEDNRLTHGKHGTPEPDFDLRGSSALCGSYETHLAIRLYNSGLNGEREKWLLVGGKEFAWTAHRYAFEFKNKSIETEFDTQQQMVEARLSLGEAEPLPTVLAPIRALKGT